MKKALSVFLSLLLAVSAVSSAVPGGVALTPPPPWSYPPTSSTPGAALLPYDSHYVLATHDACVDDLLYDLKLLETHAVHEDGKALDDSVRVKTGMTVHPIEDATTPAVHTVAVLGEVDGDGAIDAKDALKVLQHSVKLVNLEGAFLVAADVSQDLAVDAADALMILQHTVKLIRRFWFESDRPLSADQFTLIVQGPVDDVSLLQAVVDFQKRYPNVKIRLQQSDTGRATSSDSLKMQLALNKAPDVAIMSVESTVATGLKGYLLDLRQFGVWKMRDRFVPSCWDGMGSPLPGEAAQFGLPLEAYTMMMFYNQTLLNQAGVAQIPETWTEFTDALDRLRSLPGMASPYMLYAVDELSAFETGTTALYWTTYLWRLGGEVLTPDMKSAAFQREEGVAALQLYADLFENHGVVDGNNLGNAFAEGRAGFNMLSSNQYRAMVVNPQSEMEFGAAMLPQLKEGVPRYSYMSLYGVVLPDKIVGTMGDDRKAAIETARWAYEFAEHYAAGLQYQMEYSQENLSMPSLKAAEGQGVFQGDYWTTAYRQLEVSKPGRGGDLWQSIRMEISLALINVLAGGDSPKEALEAAAKQINRQLA